MLDLINVTRSDCLKVETHPTVASMKVSLLSQVSPTSSSSSTLASPFPSLLMVIPDRTVMVMVMIKILDPSHSSDGGVERIDFLQLWVWMVKMNNHRLFVVFMIGDNCFEDDNKDDGCGGLVLRCFPFTFSPRLRPCSSFSPLLPSPPPPPPHPPRQPQRLVLEYLLATPRRAPDHVRAILSFVQDIKLQCLQCSF